MDKKNKTATDNQWPTSQPASDTDTDKKSKLQKSAVDNSWVSTNKK